MSGSWKTSAAGIGAVLVAAGSAMTAMFDNDPATLPDWGAVIAAVIAGVGLLFARDNGVTSEAAGAK
jgi:uncharacterized membrane protein YhiD involved in acid resistance